MSIRVILKVKPAEFTLMDYYRLVYQASQPEDVEFEELAFISGDLTSRLVYEETEVVYPVIYYDYYGLEADIDSVVEWIKSGFSAYEIVVQKMDDSHDYVTVYGDPREINKTDSI